MTATPDNAAPDPQQIIAELQRKLDESRAELAARNSAYSERIAYQAAANDVLKVMSGSPGDPQPVFDLIVERARDLCGGYGATVYQFDGTLIHWRAATGVSDDPSARRMVEAMYPMGPTREWPAGRAIIDRQIIHISDLETEPGLIPTMRGLTVKSAVLVPLMRGGLPLGVVALGSRERGGFTDTQIELLKTFAEQAVIAITSAETYRELQQRTDDLREALQRQTATADVLKVISRSAFDLQAVLDTLVESAGKLCNATMTNIWLRDGDVLRSQAQIGLSEAFSEFLRTHPTTRDRGKFVGRAFLTGQLVHLPDVLADPEYTFVESSKIGQFRSALGVPMIRHGEVEGVFALAKPEPGGFADREIELVRTFADQALIAIENVRLFGEVQAKTRDLSEALTHQTGSANILRVIASSPTDVGPVLKAIAESACELCEAYDAVLVLKQHGELRVGAHHGQVPLNRTKWPNDRSTVSGRSIADRSPVHVHDVSLERAEFPVAEEMSRRDGGRSVLGIPMLSDGESIGAIVLRRTDVQPFSKKQITLLQTFADQAVIAIGNVRLFEQVQERTRELSLSLDNLRIISRSSVELEMVLDTLVQTVARLCRADQVYMFHLRHDLWHLIADYGLSAEARAFFQTNPFTPGRGSTSGRAAMEGRAVSITDVLHDPEYTLGEGQAIAGYRSTLGVPLFRESTLIGVFSIVRTRVDPFTNKEIELASTFADQAVIAIENARLFEELRERQAELRVTFDNMGDGVAMFGADKRLASWNRNWQKMLDLTDPFLISRPSFAELFRFLAARGEFDSTDLEAELSRSLDDTGREMRYERTRPDGRVMEVRRNPVPDGGFVLIYADITERKRAEETTRIARDAAEKALRDLQAAQDRLVQTEKLASLGQLTAGIAHEIKNPLNFVNNFAALSAELIDEMTGLFEDTALDERDRREELNEIRKLLKGNLEKVVQHGKRADSIVKNMLLHSREGSGERRSAEINRLVEESLNLAYHGARAEKPGFSITLKHDLDPEVGALDVYPQEMTRALLNLISNGFYAATRREAEADGDFEPVLSAVTKKLGDTIEIRIRDNGTGIPPEVRERMFNPFFTTKPTGEGTGLGLSMTHDIIVKLHGGTIDVTTEPGAFTEFIITLPRGGAAQPITGGRN